jgi:hypothetical protein
LQRTLGSRPSHLPDTCAVLPCPVPKVSRPPTPSQVVPSHATLAPRQHHQRQQPNTTTTQRGVILPRQVPAEPIAPLTPPHLISSKPPQSACLSPPARIVVCLAHLLRHVRILSSIPHSAIPRQVGPRPTPACLRLTHYQTRVLLAYEPTHNLPPT